MIKVFIATGPEQGSSFLIKGRIAQIGRGSANEVHLNEASVSRTHARIYKDKNQYSIEDLKSKNGTWINGNVIASGARVQVEEGVPIALGNVLLSLGKECPPHRLPEQYSIGIQPLGCDGTKPSAFIDRRAKQKKELELIYDISVDGVAEFN